MQRTDPDGGQAEPTEADYAAFKEWAIRKYGNELWERYSSTDWMPDHSY